MAARWKLPGYVVEDLLGFGGTGDVWRAHVSASGEPVALKRIPVSRPGDVQAARSEAALLSTLDHPHLMRLHELVPTADAVVLVLDLAAGGSLADLLTQRGRLTPGEVVTALAPIGAALAYAHHEGVVHGDVTPGNVLFTDSGLPLLADLGVARIVGDSAPVRSTPAYIDPAVAAGSAPGAASDVFMLAAVALHAVTGSGLWPSGEHADVVAAAARADLADLPQRLAGLPTELAAVLARALVVEPHRRCSAAEFALDLRHSAEPVPIDLAAGRARPGVPVSPDRGDPDGTPVGHLDERSEGVDEPGRPAFERPGIAAFDPSRNQLTHGVRAALRPTLPARGRRWRNALPPRRASAAAAVVLAGAMLLGWQLSRAGSDNQPAGALRPAGRSAAPMPARPAPSAPSPTVATSTDAQVAGALIALDELRERAFGRNEPALLAQVYLPGPLLVQDISLLARAVPAGCSLVGVHTTYAGVRASPGSGGRIVVTTSATLAPSTLVCGGVRSGSGAAAGPARLRIELARNGEGYRIASQRRM
ncbi:MAG: serine/threonine-protein kinase [Actinomycetota bacterium]